MTIDDDLDPILVSVVESYLAARGQPFDDISCPDLKALWEAVKDDETSQAMASWVARECRFSMANYMLSRDKVAWLCAVDPALNVPIMRLAQADSALLPRPFEIWYAQAKLGHSKDARPMLVQDIAGDMVSGHLLSASDLFNQALDFKLDPSWFPKDFPATGLPRPSYILPDIVRIHRDRLARRAGQLTGDLLKAVRKWLGI